MSFFFFLPLTIQMTHANHFNILIINKSHNSSDQYIFNPQNTRQGTTLMVHVKTVRSGI